MSPQLLRRVCAAVLVIAAGAVALTLRSSDTGHVVSFTTPSAALVRKGLAVRAGGSKVGVVTAARLTAAHQAKVTLRLDDAVWPLPADTKARLRFAGTIKFTDRFMELDPGSKQAGTIADGGSLAAGSFRSPLEFDTLLNTFDAPTREHLRAALDEGGQALGPATKPLRRTFNKAPDALGQTADLLSDLNADQQALDTLLVSGDRVIDAVQRADPGVGALLDDAQTTFTAVSSKATALQQALSEAPATLGATRVALTQADRTLGSAATLTRRLAPGITEVRALAPPLASALRRVDQVAPDLKATLRTVRTATPTINALMSRARTQSPRLESIGKQGAIQGACLRPYAPSLTGLVSTWATTWGLGDATDKNLRAVLGTFPYPNDTPSTSKEIVDTIPGQVFAFPQPPGLASGQPWFQPQCHITKDSFDASKDPERKPFAPLDKKPTTERDLEKTVLPSGSPPPGQVDESYPLPAGVKR